MANSWIGLIGDLRLAYHFPKTNAPYRADAGDPCPATFRSAAKDGSWFRYPESTGFVKPLILPAVGVLRRGKAIEAVDRSIGIGSFLPAIGGGIAA